ncbi:hypothetical protein IT157_09165, partial [bacterium]|nr:hypothetical protein [bacterium]
MYRIKSMLTWALFLCLTSLALAVDLNESFETPLFPPPDWQSIETGDGVNIWSRTQSNGQAGSYKAQVVDEDVSSGLVSERWL